MLRELTGLLALSLALPAYAELPADRFGPADLARLADVAEPALSPDGEYVAYAVTTTNPDADKRTSDLWRVRFDGRERVQLTRTPEDSEWQPQWAPDGSSLAFLSDRGGEDATTQVWLLPAGAGESRKLTDFPAGVEDYAWSPDGTRLAIVVRDPERPAGGPKPKNAPPIVIDRYWFKEDGTGYLDGRRQHLYVFDLATGRAEQITTGDHDEYLPAWSPDGKQIAYVTKRGGDPDRHLNWDIYLVEPRPGATERRLTNFAGADLAPDWESRPAWSPDGRRIAYLQGGEDKDIYYAPYQLAIVDVATGAATIPAPIDRSFTRPRWSKDGRSVYALIEQSRVTNLSRVSVADGRVTPLTSGPRFDVDFDVAGERVVVLGGGGDRPAEIAAVERRGLRPLSSHNDWLERKRLARAEDISFRSADGTEIHGFLVKPVDFVAGRRYPTILARLAGVCRGRLRRGRHQPARQLGARHRLRSGDLCRLGQQGRAGRARRRRPRRRARRGRSRAARRRRAQLRRHPHQLRDRERPTLQGRGERGGRVELHRAVRSRHVPTCTRASTTSSSASRGRIARRGIA